MISLPTYLLKSCHLRGETENLKKKEVRQVVAWDIVAGETDEG